MAEGERIGRAYVEIGADIEQLKQQLAQAESVTGASAERIAALRNDIIARSEAMQAEKQRQFGEQAIREREAMEVESAQRIAALRADITARMAGDGPKSFSGSMKAAVASVKDLQQGMAAVVGTISKTLGIAGLIVGTFSAIVGLGYKIGDALFGATKEAERLKKAMDDLGVSGAAKRLAEATEEYAKVSSELADLLENGFENTRGRGGGVDALERRKKELEREITNAQAQLNSVEKMRRQKELDNASAEEAKEAEEEQAAILKLRIQAEHKERDDKRKFAEWFRDYNEETERIIKEETKKRLEEQEKQQKAAGEAMRKMAREYGAELANAFRSADSANRAASDAMMERMATSVNRLKEIAESNRQATNRGDTSTAGGVW